VPWTIPVGSARERDVEAIIPGHICATQCNGLHEIVAAAFTHLLNTLVIFKALYDILPDALKQTSNM
jgi:hypothetical protein